MTKKNGKRYTAQLKFQVVMEMLKGDKAVGQIARAYGGCIRSPWGCGRKSSRNTGRKYLVVARRCGATNNGSGNWNVWWGRRRSKSRCSKIFWPRIDLGREAGLDDATWERIRGQ